MERKILGRSLGSYDGAKLVGGMFQSSSGYRQETTRLHAVSCTKMGWSSLTHNRVLHQTLWLDLSARAKSELSLKTHGPSERKRASGQNGRLNPLRLDITTEPWALFDFHPQSKNKALLFDINIVNPCVSSNPENESRRAEKYLADAVEPGTKKYRGSFLATYPPFVSLCLRVVRLAQTCMPS